MMTRANKLLETFTWNPNWGKHNIGRKIKFISKYHEADELDVAYYFKLGEGIEVVLAYDTREDFWCVYEYSTGRVLRIMRTFRERNTSMDILYKNMMEVLDELGGVSGIKDCIKGEPKRNPLHIQYIQ